MPTYPTGTRQWAQQEIERAWREQTRPDGSNLLISEVQDYCDEIEETLHELPEGQPIYSAEELEAAGQGGLF